MGYSKQVFTYLRAYEQEQELETQKKQDGNKGVIKKSKRVRSKEIRT